MFNKLYIMYMYIKGATPRCNGYIERWHSPLAPGVPNWPFTFSYLPNSIAAAFSYPQLNNPSYTYRPGRLPLQAVPHTHLRHVLPSWKVSGDQC